MNEGHEGSEHARSEQSTRAAFDDLRRAFIVPVEPSVAQQHLDAMFATAGDRSDTVAAQRSRRKRKLLAAAGVSAGLVFATSGLAAAGVLPEPVQRAIARAASPLGIRLPDGSSLRPSSPDGNGNQTGPDGGGGSSDQAPASDRSSTSTAPTSTSPPGNSENAPGQGGENPGNAESAPGQQTDPGNSQNAPGLGGPNPGQAPNGPGQGGQNPGNSGNSNAGGNGNGNAGGNVTPTTPTRPTTPTPPTTPPARGGGKNK
ncbi:MAG: hypothetical protein HYX32_11910 [Actinobacteria bacterium]|nr:hypothetical protein [Actinomycetota bacterium]